jgi:hypothetical protein
MMIATRLIQRAGAVLVTMSMLLVGSGDLDASTLRSARFPVVLRVGELLLPRRMDAEVVTAEDVRPPAPAVP